MRDRNRAGQKKSGRTMAAAAGYVLNVAANRRDELRFAIEMMGDAAEAVPEFSHSRNVPLICFVSLIPGRITHLAKARRGVRAGTGLRRISMSEPLELPRAVSFRAIERLVSTRMRSRVRNKLRTGGLLAPASLLEVVEALRSISPESRLTLDQFSRQRHERLARVGADARRSLAYQRDAVAVALTIAGIDRTELQGWDPPDAEPVTSFLDGLTQTRVREDPMVIHDLQNMPGFEHIRSTQFGSAVFESDSSTLTIILANRLPLEQQLGVDLIYYNETYEAFVMNRPGFCGGDRV
jgi:hypothetical protein